MKVVLRADVESIGKKGDVLDVADGYARNFLVPRGKAFKATEGAIAQSAAMRKAREVREAQDRQDALAQAERLQGATVAIAAKAGDEGKLFGSVSTADITKALHEQTGIEVDRRKLDLDHGLKELGTHTVPVKLFEDVTVDLTVNITAE